ncbi:MAG: hypothetical protein R3C49_19145 [Planctomycetaceae bacterium]
MKLQLSCCMVLVCALVNAVQADLVLDLRLDDGTRARNVASGGSAFVDLFLVDTDGTSSVSSSGGLIGGGGKLLATGSASGSAALSFANPGFDFIVDSPVLGLTDPGIASVQAAAFLFPAPAFAPGAGVTSLAGLGAMEVFLGRFAVTATGGLGDTLTLTPDRLVDFNGNTDGLGDPLDGLASFINSSATESVVLTVDAAAVPEPSTLLVATLLGVGYVSRRRLGSLRTQETAVS